MTIIVLLPLQNTVSMRYDASWKYGGGVCGSEVINEKMCDYFTPLISCFVSVLCFDTLQVEEMFGRHRCRTANDESQHHDHRNTMMI